MLRVKFSVSVLNICFYPMDTISTNLNLWIWLGVITLVGGVGLVILLRAYTSNGSGTPQFTQPITSATPPITRPDEIDAVAQKAFAKGNAAFSSGRYRWAADQYAQALQVTPDWAEAYHNRGLAVANLRQTGDAAQDLAKAASLYLDLDNTSALDLVRQHLQELKA
jgi:tetratricopeptide (TPR) repeat protein